MAPPSIQLAYRSVAGLTVANGPPDGEPAEGFERPEGNIRTFQYSPDGSRLAWIGPEGVRVVNALTGQLVFEIPNKGIMDLGFSPKGTFLSTWERYQKPPAEDAPQHRNLVIWDVGAGRARDAFTSKILTSAWNVKWTDDERYYARLATNEIQFFDTRGAAPASEDGGAAAPQNPVAFRLKLDNVSDFSIAPVGYQPALAAFVPEKKGQPGSIRIFPLHVVAASQSPAPVAQKTFFKAEKCQFFWNGVGTALLVLTQTEVAAGNYYGDTALYYLATNGKLDCRVTLDDDGPIHDVHWHPNSGEFGVTHGRMPAQTTLFNPSCQPVYAFPRAHRNYLRYSPSGRLICMGGFGNLAGDMDFYDRRTLRRVSTVHAPNSTVAEWSPCGRYVLTATLTPRLRVDNGYRAWHYTGVVVDKRDVAELYQIAWRPDPAAARWPDARELSPPPRGVEEPAAAANGAAGGAPAVKPLRPAGKYIPPGARDRAAAAGPAREDGGLPGLAGLEQHLEKTGAAGQREVPGLARDARQGAGKPLRGGHQGQARGGGQGGQGQRSASGRYAAGPAGPAGGAAPAAPDAVPPMPAPQQAAKDPAVAETEKKLRTVQRKLKEIQDLKQKMAAGQKLELTQISKMEKEAEFLLELESLTAGMKKLVASFT